MHTAPPLCPECNLVAPRLKRPDIGANEWEIVSLLSLPGPCAAYRWLFHHDWQRQPLNLDDGNFRYKPPAGTP